MATAPFGRLTTRIPAYPVRSTVGTVCQQGGNVPSYTLFGNCDSSVLRRSYIGDNLFPSSRVGVARAGTCHSRYRAVPGPDSGSGRFGTLYRRDDTWCLVSPGYSQLWVEHVAAQGIRLSHSRKCHTTNRIVPPAVTPTATAVAIAHQGLAWLAPNATTATSSGKGRGPWSSLVSAATRIASSGSFASKARAAGDVLACWATANRTAGWG